MKVRFLGNKLSDKVNQKFDSNDLLSNRDYHFLQDEEYLVLGIRINNRGGVTLDCLDMYNHISFAPLDFFEVVDNQVSKYWLMKAWADGDVSLYPKEYYEEEYFHDDLSENVPEIVAKFHNLVRRLKDE